MRSTQLNDVALDKGKLGRDLRRVPLGRIGSPLAGS
jgi:hypothetical protein